MAEFTALRIPLAFSPMVLPQIGAEADPSARGALLSSAPSARYPRLVLPDHGAPDRAPAVEAGPDPAPVPSPVMVEPAPAPSSAPTADLAAQIAEAVAAAEERVRAEAAAELEAHKAATEAERREEQAALTNIIASVEEGRARWATESRDLAGELVLGAVAHLVGDVPELGTAMLRARLGELMARLAGERGVQVRVRPSDLAMARLTLGERSDWRVVPDDRMRGGCVVETAAGRLDASLEAAMDELGQMVRAWRDEVSADGIEAAS